MSELANMGAMIDAVVLQIAKNYAADMTEWAKKNHPWHNQSTKLESSIEPIAEKRGKKIRCGIGEGMDYARYVETMQDGGKGVIKITLNHYKPWYQDDICKAIEKLHV